MNKIQFPDRNSLRAEYDRFLNVRSHMVRRLETRIRKAIAPLASRSRVEGRLKSFDSFFKKYIRLLKNGGGNEKSPENFPRINDIIGIRIICPFLEDLAAVEELLKENFNVFEVEHKGGDHTFREFGYESIHLLVSVPDDITSKYEITHHETAEIQIRTILQDAWAEVEHELVYKAEFNPFDNPLKRKLAAVNATLSLADIIFQEIRSYQRELNGELGKRRDSFFRKIEEFTDDVLFIDEKPRPKKQSPALRNAVSGDNEAPEGKAASSGSFSELENPLYTDPSVSSDSVSIDDLLLNALYAHNKNQFDEAIAFYTRILAMNPDDNVSALIYKHRGMAYFARSHYNEAIKDFSVSLKLDPKSYKAAYYKGVICSVLKRHSQAVEAFNQSLEINPYQAYCLYRRGQAYYHIEDYPQALGDCEAALALESFDAALKFKELLLQKLKM